MTEQEAIEQLKCDMGLITFNPDNGENISVECLNDLNRATYEADKIAISALEEIQQYKSLGTVKDIKKIINFLSLNDETGLIDDATLLNQYRMLGSVEELKEAREKQIAKKVIRRTETIYDTIFEYFFCARCYREKKVVLVQRFCKYCPECGNGIDWSKIYDERQKSI